MALQGLWLRRAAKPFADTFVSLRDTMGLRPHLARVAHGICGITATCSRADQYTGMTVERYNRKRTRLSVGDGVHQYGTDGRGGLTSRLSGYRRLAGETDDVTKGYGIRSASIPRRSNALGRSVVPTADAHWKSYRLQLRSSYSTETRAAPHNLEDGYRTIVMLRKPKSGPRPPAHLSNVTEPGGLYDKVYLTTDVESAFKPLSCKDLKIPTEGTLMGHISWIR